MRLAPAPALASAPAPALALALALGLAAVPLVLPAAAAAPGFDHDVSDARGDVVTRLGAGPATPTERPGLDLVRGVTAREGERVVARVTLAAPLEARASLNVHVEVGPPGHTLTLTFHHDASLPEAERAGGVLVRPGEAPRAVPTTWVIGGANVTLAFPVSAVPADLACFEPAVVAGAIVETPEGLRSAEDLLDHEAHAGARCGAAEAPAPAASAALALAALAAAAARRRERP